MFFKKKKSSLWDNLPALPRLVSSKEEKEDEEKFFLPIDPALTNENSLREEGALFGINGAPVNEKEAQIRNSYKASMAPAQKRLEELHERIGAHNMRIEHLEQKKKDLRQLLHEKATYIPHEEHLFTSSLVLLGTLLGYVGFVYFIGIHLPYDNPWPLAAGLPLLGLFANYQGANVFVEGQKHTYWRILEWYMLPLALSLVLYAETYSTLSLPAGLALIFLCFMVFGFAGRLLVEHSFNWTKSCKAWSANRSNNTFMQKEKEQVEQKIEELSEMVEEIRREKWQLSPEISSLEGQVQHFHAKAESAVNIFLAEYAFATSLKERIGEEQLKTLLKI